MTRFLPALAATAVAASAAFVLIGTSATAASGDGACPTLNPTRYVGAPNEAVAVGITSSRPDTFTTVTVTRTNPTPSRVIIERGQYGNFGPYISASQNSRFAVTESSGNPDCAELAFAIDIQPRLSINAVRNSPRDYTFRGRVTPGRGQQVTLYRTSPDGTGPRVIAAQTVVGSEGTWTIRRVFTGSGRFGFVAAVPGSTTNLAGASPTRPTVIH